MLLGLLATLPHSNGQVACKEHVEQVLHLIGDLKPKGLTHHTVPGGPIALVHGLLDDPGGTLRGKQIGVKRR